MTLPPRADAPPSRRPPFLLPTPSRRAATRAHVAASVILILETMYWLPQPCAGDAVCAPVIGILTGAALIPLVLTFVVWRVAGRASGVVVVDTLLVAVTAPLLPSLLFSGNPISLVLGGVPLLLAFGLTGAARDLGPYFGERIFTVVLLAGLAAWLVAQGVPLLALVPVLVAILVALGVLSGRAQAEPLLETD